MERKKIQYDTKGKICEAGFIVAEQVSIPDSIKKMEPANYYVLAYSGQLFDPQDISHNYKTRNRWAMKKVPQLAFINYLKYLQGGKKLFLTNASRNS